MQSNKLTIITTAILILMVLGAGCIDTAGTSHETTTYTPPPEESPVVEETATSEPTPEPVETAWYVDKYGFEDAEVGTHSTLFGDDLYAVKNSAYGIGNYDLFDT